MSTETSARKPRGGVIDVGVCILAIKLRLEINQLGRCSRIQVDVKAADDAYVLQPGRDKCLKALVVLPGASVQLPSIGCRSQQRRNREFALRADIRWHITGPLVGPFGVSAQQAEVVQVSQHSLRF